MVSKDTFRRTSKRSAICKGATSRDTHNKVLDIPGTHEQRVHNVKQAKLFKNLDKNKSWEDNKFKKKASPVPACYTFHKIPVAKVPHNTKGPLMMQGAPARGLEQRSAWCKYAVHMRAIYKKRPVRLLHNPRLGIRSPEQNSSKKNKKTTHNWSIELSDVCCLFGGLFVGLLTKIKKKKKGPKKKGRVPV